MYPQRELILLAARKAVLRQSIARRRDQCAVDTVRVMKPLELLDRALILWRRIPPLVKLTAIPLGLLVIKRTVFPQRKINILGPLLRWGSILFGTMRSLNPPSKKGSEAAR